MTSCTSCGAVVRRLRPLITVAAVAALLSACGDDGGDANAGSGDEAPKIMATTSIMADITSKTTCGEVEVVSLIPEGTDAHEYEPSAREADELEQASLVVAVGLGLEQGLTGALQQASSAGVQVVEVGPAVQPLESSAHHDEDSHTGEDGHSTDEDSGSHAGDGGEQDHGHDHGGMDPHVWMDPDRMATAVGVIAEQLRTLEGLPLLADKLDACAENYQAELRSLGAEMDETLAAVPAPRRKLVTNHEALGYFADRFDFEVIGAVIPSTSSLGESNPRQLEELAQAIQAAGVPAIFAETTQPAEVAQALARRVGTGVQVVELYTETLGPPKSGADSYADMMRTNAKLVAGALTSGAATAPSTPAGG